MLLVAMPFAPSSKGLEPLELVASCSDGLHLASLLLILRSNTFGVGQIILDALSLSFRIWSDASQVLARTDTSSFDADDWRKVLGKPLVFRQVRWRR